MSLTGPTFGPETQGARRRSRGDAEPVIAAAPRVSGNLNDPTQQLLKLADGVFALDGKGSNRGFAPSELQMKIDGKDVRVAVGGGQTPAQTLKKLEAALPEGYQIEKLETPSQFRGSVRFRIVKSDASSAPQTAEPPPRPTRRDDDGGYVRPSRNDYGGLGGGIGGGCWGTGRGGMGW
jgi:hypothetical protein